MSHNPLFHSCFCEKNQEIINWYRSQLKGSELPFYSSYDLRDSGFKVAVVDANIFPAGFNNICDLDFSHSVELVKNYFQNHYVNSKEVHKILLLAESHTNNLYYWDNVSKLKDLFTLAGIETLVGIAKRFEGVHEMQMSNGTSLGIISAYFDNPMVKDFRPQLVISNNDFSESLNDWFHSVSVPIVPPRKMGWHWRKKSDFFKRYNRIALDFSQVVNQDPFQYTIKTELFPGFDIGSKENMEQLALRIDQMISDIQRDYRERGIQEQPFVFVKNNSGTYGLGVTKVNFGKDVLSWNYKSRKKMKASKGNLSIEEVILQEGIATRVQSDGVVAEPVIYMIEESLSGGFLRTHVEKNNQESLNAVGAIYKRLCTSDLYHKSALLPYENVYGWIARLGLLAITKEIQDFKRDKETDLSPV